MKLKSESGIGFAVDAIPGVESCQFTFEVIKEGQSDRRLRDTKIKSFARARLSIEGKAFNYIDAKPDRLRPVLPICFSFLVLIEGGK